MRGATSATFDLSSSSKAPVSSSTNLAFGTFGLLLAIAVAALLLRFVNLDQWGLWVDELYTVQHAAELADGDIDTRSIGYAFSLLGFELGGVDMAGLDSDKIWTWQSAGITEWNMRAPIALLGAVTILVLGLLSHRTFGTRPTLLLCLLMALSPWHLWMSQAGRFYMQLFLLHNLGLLLYYQATEEGRLSRAIFAMVAIVLAFFTTPIALMIFGILGLDVVLSWLRRRPSGMRPAFWVVAAVGLAVCAAGILYSFANRADGYSAFIGTQQSIPVMTMGMVYMVGVPMVVMAALGFWCMFAKNERLATLLALSALLPLATFIGFNLLGSDTHVRYMFVALFAWLALAAVGIEVMITSVQAHWGRLAAWLPALALLSTLALADYIYMTGGAGYRGLWRQAMAYVEENRQPGELVGGDFVAHRMSQYYLEDPDALYLPHRNHVGDLAELVQGPAWLVYRVHQPSTGDRSRKLTVTGKLQAYFNNRIAEPYQAINVYYYRPPES